jgi:hypothetical protein
MSFEQGFKEELQKLGQVEELALPGRIDTSIFPQMSEIERQALESEMANKKLLEEEQSRRGVTKYLYPGLMLPAGYAAGATGGAIGGSALQKALASGSKALPKKYKDVGKLVGAVMGGLGGATAAGVGGAFVSREQQEKERESQEAIDRLLGRVERKRQGLYEQAGYPAGAFGTPTFGGPEAPYTMDPSAASAAVAAQRLAAMRGA